MRDPIKDTPLAMGSRKRKMEEKRKKKKKAPDLAGFEPTRCVLYRCALLFCCNRGPKVPKLVAREEME